MTGQYGTAVVTGASSGIGAEVCRTLSGEGCRVVGMSRRRSPHASLSLHVDVADATQVQAAFAGIDPPAVVVHSAGMVDPIAALTESDPESWTRNVAVNLVGLYHVLRFGLPPMVDAGSGLVIHLSTGAAQRVYHSWSAYCAAKAGAEHLVRVAALEAEGSGVGICALNPGITETPMQELIRATDFPSRDRFVQVHEERSSRTVDEVADALVRLTGQDPPAVNGRTFEVDEV